MVVSSGFAEAGEQGRALQEELRRGALRNESPCSAQTSRGSSATTSTGLRRTARHPHRTPSPDHFYSQSGTVAWTMSQQASDRGVGLRMILGVGNEAVLGLGDLFEWAAEDRHTKLVATYVETIRDVEGIGRGLDALRAARKPVLVCAPQGGSEAVRRSIAAHTGALADDGAFRDAWLRARGAILVEDPVALFEAAVLLSSHRRLRTTGVAAALQSGRRLHAVRGGGWRSRVVAPGVRDRLPGPSSAGRSRASPRRTTRST